VAWASDELDRIGEAEELQLASLRPEGALRKPVTVWVVRAGDDLYVRSVYGRSSGWFRGVQSRHEGHVSAGGIDKDVRFAEVDDEGVNDEIDEAYRTKYRDQPTAYVDPTVTPQARAATLRLEPRS
jgi:hypothetical protein